MKISDGDPGEAFLTFDKYDKDRWVIWKILDGEDLALVRELGYKYPKVVSLILTGDKLNPPHTGKTDLEDMPYAISDANDSMFDGVEWTPLGRL